MFFGVTNIVSYFYSFLSLDYDATPHIKTAFVIIYFVNDQISIFFFLFKSILFLFHI